MKKIVLVFVVISSLGFSCKKAIEEKKQDILIDIITNGRWYIERYEANGADITGDFFNYEFQFYADGKVDGIKGASVKSGTWAGSSSTRTVSANFPAAAGDTLIKLNYTWRIDDSGIDYVKSSTNIPGGTNILNLRKK